jgi:glycosyltransferase involved in cell wall biosynthesis
MKISIITPNFNYESFIGDTIESIINQNYIDYEHIIVDDGSTDNSLQIIKKYQSLYHSKIILISQKNQGQSIALNRALKEIKGDIISWINSDDSYCPGVFANIVRYLNDNPTVDIVFGDINIINTAGKVIRRKRYLSFNQLFGKCFGYSSIMSSNTVFFRKSLLNSCNSFDERLKCNMDGEFFSRLTSKKNVKHLNCVIANFRKQPQSKAAENHRNWKEIVYTEVEFELKQSYKTLLISKYVPYKYSFIIKLPIRIYRIILRLIYLHYVKELFENIRKKTDYDFCYSNKYSLTL